MAVSSAVVSRSELEDGASASRLCEAGPASGKGIGLAALIAVAVLLMMAARTGARRRRLVPAMRGLLDKMVAVADVAVA